MLTAARISERVRRGELAPTTVTEEALDRIAKLDGEIKAWTHVDANGARESAARLEKETLDGAGLPLAGVPVGVKDIIDVAGLPTTAGAAPFAHHLPERDAAVVAALCRAGAIVVGKTATTEFAYLDPAPTRNPWNPGHTPGGSSSGSAAAVAAQMVPVALGTQTVGSVLRPAAYCGVVGFKPGYGMIDTCGIAPLAWSFDHAGIFARSVEDAALVLWALAGVEPDAGLPPSALRLGVPRSFFEERASAEVRDHLEGVARRLCDRGALVVEVALAGVDEWMEAGRPVLAAEAATFHEPLFAVHEAEYRPHLRSLVEAGLALPATHYVRARRALAGLRARTVSLFDSIDALLLPVAPSTAPEGLSSTGDASFCAPASFAGLPSIALPSGLGGGGLPLAVQLVAAPGRDAQLLALARWVETAVDFRETPAMAAQRAGGAANEG